MNNKQILKKLHKTQCNYESSVTDVEKTIFGKVGFEFKIIYQDSDGWCLLNSETSDLAPFDSCLSIIEDVGFLSENSFKQLCI